jgi:hypothetical protein
MSIFRIGSGDIETTTVVTNPVRTYVSSSTRGTTGSIHVFPRRSSVEKEVAPVPSFLDSVQNDEDINAELASVQASGRVLRNSTNASARAKFSSIVESYMDKVNAQSVSSRKQKVLEIDRFVPPFSFTKDTAKKLVIKDLLDHYYRASVPSAQWSFTNYNSLNFFTASTVPTGSALLYPNVEGGPAHEGYMTGTYSLSGAFSFDFYVNPRYSTSVNDGQFKAGTIMHLSSSYAVSLVSGSRKDENGRPTGFRIQLQLSHSADVAPSLATPGTYPNDLVFLSDDNSLTKGAWHHVVIRWGTSAVNQGTGSFNIDGADRGTFVVPSGTINLRTGPLGPACLVIGNHLGGRNVGSSAHGLFFATNPSTRDGLNVLVNDGGSAEAPTTFSFDHPLNAELHDVCIRRRYMTDLDISVSASRGPLSIDDDVAFYLPPFFVQEAPFRQAVGTYGGILQTPFLEVDGTTDDPFNVAMAFGVGGHYINIENYLRDFASDIFPRCHLMTGTARTETTVARSANEFLYDDPLVRRRNLLIMPCDDGSFIPSFELLVSESALRFASGSSTTRDKYVDFLGNQDPSVVSLDNMLSTASLLFGQTFDDASGDSTTATEFIEELIGFTPEQPGLSPGRGFGRWSDSVSRYVASGTFEPGVQLGAPLTIYQRTKDSSSNQVTIFNISNLYYGKRILPGSLTLTDRSLSGSSGAITVTLKDDGLGNLHRADCVTSASTWASVGTVYYNEGLIVVKSPHLFFFGQDAFELSFRGEQNVHVMKVNVLAPANHLNSSSNPTFTPMSASSSPTDVDSDFVYVTGINLHDENLNVVMKAQLAQPITKRHGERVLFRLRLDH